MRLLLVLPNQRMSQAVGAALQNLEAVIEWTATGEEAVQLAKRYEYDVIILDTVLPDMEGFDLIRMLRYSSVTLPILVVSSALKATAKLRAFTLGADDFLAAPWDEMELAARVRALVRRSRGFSNSRIFMGPLVLDIDSHDVEVSGKKLHLTSTEYRILALLVVRSGSIIAKESFLTHIYDEIDRPDTKIIDVFVCKLRKKLRSAGLVHFIETVWGRGYIVRQPLTRDQDELTNPAREPTSNIAIPRSSIAEECSPA
jgi:two-component system cell cycle response regulator CtrA